MNIIKETEFVRQFISRSRYAERALVYSLHSLSDRWNVVVRVPDTGVWSLSWRRVPLGLSDER